MEYVCYTTAGELEKYDGPVMCAEGDWAINRGTRQQAPGNQSLQMHNWLYQSQVVVAHTAINLCPIAPGF